MEKFANSTLLYGVIDVTATEGCDHLLGGVAYVGSVGPLDMINFWAIDTLPARYAERNLRRHNPHETLMRTTAAESRRIGSWIAEKLKSLRRPVCLLIPEKGISALHAPGQPFHDPIADAALFEAIEQTLRRTCDRRFDRIARHRNDPEFSHALV
jgi:uncharacterized protein (UPF0261 family)